MAPEDRVGADAALPVIDERALVVRAQEYEVAVEPEQVALVETGDLAVRQCAPVPDHPPQVPLRGRYLGHGLDYRGTSTCSAFRSASKVASMTSPRSSPSAWSGVGASQTIRSSCASCT